MKADTCPRLGLRILVCILCFGCISLDLWGDEGDVLVSLRGTDFVGGAQERFGASHYGERHTNFVYAQPTGDFSRMTATFRLDLPSEKPLALHVLACNNDLGAPCRIAVTLNGAEVFTGPARFPNAIFRWDCLDVPQGAWRLGQNELVISNSEERGGVGQPPWFMLSKCLIADVDFQPSTVQSVAEDFRVDLPAERRPYPTPLNLGENPGFALRGTKGWLWRPEQYGSVLPTLATYRGNFLMICYGSMWNIEGYPEWPEKNAWWLPLPEAKRRAYEALLRACTERGVELCFSMNPNLGSSRIMRYDSSEDMDALWQHYQTFQGFGMTWFSLCLDDISEGVDAAGQARVANELRRRLRAKDAAAQLVFCPSVYWGDGTGESPACGNHETYLSTLADQLSPDIFLFWTGDQVVAKHISVEAATAYRERCGHRLILWDNYPVNDGNPTLHLGPVSGRDPNLGDVCYGYMSNPLASQHEMNTIPLLTCLDYAWNPVAYDPATSIGQAVLTVAKTPEQAEVLRDLVELFPGMLVYGQGTAYNPVLSRFGEILDTPHSRYMADLYIGHVRKTATRLDHAFASEFSAAKNTIALILGDMNASYRATYGINPVSPHD